MKSEYSLAPMDTAIAMAQWHLDIEGVSDHIPALWQLARFAVGKIDGLLLQGVKIFTQDVVGGVAKIPQGSKVLAIRYCTDIGEETEGLFADFAWVNKCNVAVDELARNFTSDVMITNDSVQFQWPKLAPKKIKIAVLTKSYDTEGFPMVPEHYLDAITFYICTYFCRKYPKKYTQAQKDEFYNDWVAARNFSVGKDAIVNWQRNPLQAKRIQSSTMISI
jgi:hypothetical protein